MQASLARVLFVAASLATPCFAQILPGHSIATVAVTGLPGEMYDIDHQAGTATLLTISSTLATQVPNCVLMTNPVTGYVGANTTGNVFSITVASGIVTE